MSDRDGAASGRMGIRHELLMGLAEDFITGPAFLIDIMATDSYLFGTLHPEKTNSSKVDK